VLSTSNISPGKTSRLQTSQNASPFFLLLSCELHGLWTKMVSTAIMRMRWPFPVKRLTTDSYRIRWSSEQQAEGREGSEEGP
jgi:hypothetical protein